MPRQRTSNGSHSEDRITPPFARRYSGSSSDFVTIRIVLWLSDVVVLSWIRRAAGCLRYGDGGTKDDTATGMKSSRGKCVRPGGADSENFPATSFQGTGSGLFV